MRYLIHRIHFLRHMDSLEHDKTFLFRIILEFIMLAYVGLVFALGLKQCLTFGFHNISLTILFKGSEERRFFYESYGLSKMLNPYTIGIAFILFMLYVVLVINEDFKVGKFLTLKKREYIFSTIILVTVLLDMFSVDLIHAEVLHIPVSTIFYGIAKLIYVFHYNSLYKWIRRKLEEEFCFKTYGSFYSFPFHFLVLFFIIAPGVLMGVVSQVFFIPVIIALIYLLIIIYPGFERDPAKEFQKMQELANAKGRQRLNEINGSSGVKRYSINEHNQFNASSSETKMSDGYSNRNEAASREREREIEREMYEKERESERKQIERENIMYKIERKEKERDEIDRNISRYEDDIKTIQKALDSFRKNGYSVMTGVTDEKTPLREIENRKRDIEIEQAKRRSVEKEISLLQKELSRI